MPLDANSLSTTRKLVTSDQTNSGDTRWAVGVASDTPDGRSRVAGHPLSFFLFFNYF